VRELYNFLQRAVVFSEGTQILLTDLCDLPAVFAASKSESGTFREARNLGRSAAGKKYREHLLEIRLCFEITSPALYPLQRLEKAKQSLVHRYVGTGS
jgi:DNA-binding NtrC family response regulator